MTYNLTPEGRALRAAPWTCPLCQRTMKVAGSGPHRLHCGKREAHFWSRADKDGAGDCWIFKGCRDKWGYAQHGISTRRVQAHRHAYELTHGTIPAGMLVLHSCHNPPCVNPEHLSLGTNQDNMDDKVAAGRAVRGEAMHNSKLTEEAVRAIKRDFVAVSKRMTNARELASRYGVTPGAICAIIAGRAWKHVL